MMAVDYALVQRFYPMLRAESLYDSSIDFHTLLFAFMYRLIKKNSAWYPLLKYSTRSRHLAETQRQVSYDDALKLADHWGVPYIECSSRTGENVADVFHIIMKEIEKDDGLLAETVEGGCSIL